MNSLMFAGDWLGADRFRSAHFPNSRHGLGLTEEQPDVAADDLLAAWLVRLDFVEVNDCDLSGKDLPESK